MADETFATKTDPLKGQRGIHEPSHPVLTLAFHVDPSRIGARRVLAGKLTLGRKCDAFGAAALVDDLLSRKHAEVVRSGEQVVVHDLASRNGTFVNGERVREALLEPGDVVGIGSVLLLFHNGPLAFRPPNDRMLIGGSYALAQVLAELDKVAPQDTTVLIHGETGSGKELVAQALHQRSGRKGAFVPINCGAIGDGVVHSELFGHVRGAFSGAGAARSGLIVTAEGGTLLLDEVGDASASLQTSLLRLLENREYRPVGGDGIHKTDARFVAASHLPLENAAMAGRFRSDLLSRLQRWVIHVPPLRDRREDIIPIAVHIAQQLRGTASHISRPLAAALLCHDWPGNVRELQATMERATIESPADGELELTPRVGELLRAGGAGSTTKVGPDGTTEKAIAAHRKQRPSPEYLTRRYVELGCNLKAFAAELSVARNTLYRWFQEAGLDPNELRRKP